MNWYKTSQLDSRTFFTPQFQTLLNDCYLECNKHRLNNSFYLKETDMTLQEAINHPKVLKDFEPILNTKIIFTNRINKSWLSGFAVGEYNGQQVILLNPQQPGNDYAKGFIHEMKHLLDKSKGKDVSTTESESWSQENWSKYNKLPSERRARDSEKKYDKKDNNELV
jgi:hypothetical protein